MLIFVKFIEICAKKLSWDTKTSEEGIIWEGDGINEVGKRADLIVLDRNLFDIPTIEISEVKVLFHESRHPLMKIDKY